MRAIRLKDSTKFWLFISPWMIAFAAFTLVPMALSLVMCFTSVKITTMFTREWRFIGFLNFTDIFTTDDRFVRSILNTFIYSVCKVAISLIASLLVALLLNKKIVFRNGYRVLIYLPAIIPAVSSALLWNLLVYQDRGLIVNLFEMMGFGRIDFGRPQYAMPSVLIINTMGMVGPWMVILLAALQGVPRDIVEACELEGISPLQKLWHITLPLISPSVFFLSVTGFINSLQAYAEIELLIRDNYYTYTMSMSIMDNAFGGLGMGYASAQAWVVFVIISAFTLIFFKLTLKKVYYMGD